MVRAPALVVLALAAACGASVSDDDEAPDGALFADAPLTEPQIVSENGPPLETDEELGEAEHSLSHKFDDPFVPGCTVVYPKASCEGTPKDMGLDLCLRNEWPKQILREIITTGCEGNCCTDATSRSVDCDAECKKKGQAVGKCVEDIDGCTDGTNWTETSHCRCYDAEPAQNPGPAVDYCKCPITPTAPVVMAWDNCKTCEAGSDCATQECALQRPDGSLVIFSCMHHSATIQMPLE
jgi:hypothetical protein